MATRLSQCKILETRTYECRNMNWPWAYGIDIPIHIQNVGIGIVRVLAKSSHSLFHDFSGRLWRDIFGAPGKSQNIVNYDDDLMDFKVYDGANVNICLQRDSHPRKVCKTM